jgi:ATP-dependent RNA helicase DDX46/PRP5
MVQRLKLWHWPGKPVLKVSSYYQVVLIRFHIRLIFVFFTALSASLPPKPPSAISRTALTSLGLKGLPLKPDLLKKQNAAKGGKGLVGVMDDDTESTRKLVTLGDMPEVDMTMEEGGEVVGDNLEAGDDDDDLLEKKDNKMDMDDEEEDPLDAFMSTVTEKVRMVNGTERNASSRLGARVDDNDEDTQMENDAPVVDEIDATNLNPEDILA